ncbi:MAG: hypothetical protein EOP87_17200 [Verrucomicrobiaceae bacterium]|nr:MAG: hypothetical protein EOP87_17200 [Verrucomicrobiaceae bacterium]
MIGTLRDSSPAKLLRMALLRTSPEDASADCLGATHFWSPFHDTAAFRHAIPLAMKTSGNEAVSLLQIFSSRETGQTDIRPVYFEKSSSGWLWTPLPRAGVMNEFKSWIETETGTWSEKWQDTLLSAVTVLDKNFLPPSQEEARSCVEAWLTAVRQGDLEKALSLSARFSAPKSTVTTLRNTGYEILAARRNREPASIRGIYQGHFWTAAGVITVLDKKPSHPLYAVVKTTAGPRILIETDLIASGNRSREYLNKEALGLVAKSAGTEAAADLRSLLDRYQSEIASGFDAPVPSK